MASMLTVPLLIGQVSMLVALSVKTKTALTDLLL